MANRRLREIIVNLNSRLSNDDRGRLHFYLKDDVRRTAADDSSFVGTFHLMQELFEQDKMNENDFTFLIETFQKIQCFDAVKLLKEHERRMHLSGCNQSTVSLASMMPTLIDEVLNDDDHDEDKYPTNRLFDEYIELERKKNHFNSNNTLNEIAENDDTISHLIETHQSDSVLLPPSKHISRKSSCAKKRFILLYIFFVLVLITLTVVLVMQIERIRHLKQNCQSTGGNIKVPSANNPSISSVQMQNNLIKTGRKFGGEGGTYFDDSTVSNFTLNYYLSEFSISSLDRFDACQFTYRSSRGDQSRIESPVHGNGKQPISLPHEYRLDDDERIKQVHVLTTVDIVVDTDNTTHPGIKRIKRIQKFQFITTKNRKLPNRVVLPDNGFQTENFLGYTLGYVTGRTGLIIDQLQFVWYRTE